MRNVLTDPLWQAEDLGKPLPDSPHACSVALPLWEQVIGYEEMDPDILEKLQIGYPRFILCPPVRALNMHVRETLGIDPRQGCLTFPSEGAARRCGEYLLRKRKLETEVKPIGAFGLHAAVFKGVGADTAMEYWRNCGEIVSTRQAEAALSGEGVDGSEAKATLRTRLAELSGQDAEDVFLFPSGMSAVFTVMRMFWDLFPDRKSAQLEFPYADVLRVQQETGPGVHFYPRVGAAEIAQLSDILEGEKLSAMLCEMPSNPLMSCLDIQRVAELATRHEVPVVIDDTVASVINVDAFMFADLVTTSLTKWFSGTGDVMGGSVILRKDSPFRDRFSAYLRGHAYNELWDGDAIALEENSRDFPQRMQTFNANGEALYEHLAASPKIAELFYPRSRTLANYEQVRRPEGGYGGLMSLVLKDPAKTAAFYNHLRCSKGPSLGTNFTLICPYTLLAHYYELEWAEECGVSRYLVRVSAGLEDLEELKARFDDALTHAG